MEDGKTSGYRTYSVKTRILHAQQISKTHASIHTADAVG